MTAFQVMDITGRANREAEVPAEDRRGKNAHKGSQYAPSVQLPYLRLGHPEAFKDLGVVLAEGRRFSPAHRRRS